MIGYKILLPAEVVFPAKVELYAYSQSEFQIIYENMSNNGIQTF